MALIFLGLTECPICGQVLDDDEEVMGFPAFAFDENDPLWEFSGAGFHEHCLKGHSKFEEVRARVQEHLDNTGPGHRKCEVCGIEVLDPGDYLLVGHLTYDQADPLYGFNYRHFHIPCLGDWKDRTRLIALLKELQRTGRWSGAYLDGLIQTLEIGPKDSLA